MKAFPMETMEILRKCEVDASVTLSFHIVCKVILSKSHVDMFLWNTIWRTDFVVCRTFLQYLLCAKIKHCRNVLGRVLGWKKNRYKKPSLGFGPCLGQLGSIRLFKGLRLLFLPNVPGTMFIPRATSILDSRVHKLCIEILEIDHRSTYLKLLWLSVW